MRKEVGRFTKASKEKDREEEREQKYGQQQNIDDEPQRGN